MRSPTIRSYADVQANPRNIITLICFIFVLFLYTSISKVNSRVDQLNVDSNSKHAVVVESFKELRETLKNQRNYVEEKVVELSSVRNNGNTDSQQ
jgi:hypothetical protein